MNLSCQDRRCTYVSVHDATMQNEQATHPLYTPVYLAKDWLSRRKVYESLKDMKLLTATQYLIERSRNLDELLPHSSQNVSKDTDGNIICSQFEIVQFTNVKSLREVYDATQNFFAYEEMILSERLKLVAIRDNTGMADGVAVNSRKHWTDINGITTEWNTICYADFVDGEHAVLVSDSVDADERFPFQPSTRARRDWSGGLLLTASKRPEDDSLVVVMRRAVLTKLHLPDFPLTAHMKATLIKAVFGWTDIMTAAIRSQLTLPDPAPPACPACCNS